MNYINENGFLDVSLLPLSNDENERRVQEMIINGEELSLNDKLKLRDRAITKLDNYQLASDHIYRATRYNCLKDYIEKGYLNDDEGKGRSDLIHWYLGGTSIRYGKVIIEANAIPDKIALTNNYGGLMSGNPYVRHVTSNQENPIRLDEITRIFFLDFKGDKVLKLIDMFNVKDINLEAREGNLLYQIDYLEYKKNTYNSFSEQELLDSLNEELFEIKEVLAKNNKMTL